MGGWSPHTVFNKVLSWGSAPEGYAEVLGVPLPESEGLPQARCRLAVPGCVSGGGEGSTASRVSGHPRRVTAAAAPPPPPPPRGPTRSTPAPTLTAFQLGAAFLRLDVPAPTATALVRVHSPGPAAYAGGLCMLEGPGGQRCVMAAEPPQLGRRCATGNGIRLGLQHPKHGPQGWWRWGGE